MRDLLLKIKAGKADNLLKLYWNNILVPLLLLFLKKKGCSDGANIEADNSTSLGNPHYLNLTWKEGNKPILHM